MENVDAVLSELGIDICLLQQRGLRRHPQAPVLEAVACGNDGREHRLAPAAAQAWRVMRSAAASDGIQLDVISAYRSVARQAEIIRAQLAAGRRLVDVLTVLAAPGYSEHHTGRAVDISTPGIKAVQVEFEQTAAFAWLMTHAADFGFRLSYPRDNAEGYQYEPWHWCFHAPAV
ncbi:MAG: M15 family metallopeptidase [Gammaproteobacteria bacterium]|nr:M15 family metallopeptidase [Gammaproteobacteria bacterium]